MSNLDIGVIYTHESAWMPRLLTSLRGSSRGLRANLLMVDNGSADGASQWVRYFPDATILRNQRRLTYAANLNRILRASTAPYVLLLNTDLYFDPQQQCLAKMVRFMEEHPRCGVAGCAVYHEDGSYAYPARRFQTLPIILSRRLGLARLLHGALDHYFYKDRSIEDSFVCDWLSGCFLMIRRQAFLDVGYFDEGFPKYFEDCDICLRMARHGWTAMYHGQTYCYHLEHRASRRLLSFDAWKHARSYVRWLQKWGFTPDVAADAAGPNRRAA
jgi:GT2 family glycosyltransferase